MRIKISTYGNDIQSYKYMMKKANDCNIDINIESEGFLLTRKIDGCILGKIDTVESCLQYLYGYESGYNKGLIEGMKSSL